MGQYVAILGWHKIIIGGGGQPNTWYHDDKPYAGTEPTPNGGCWIACQQQGCMHVPNVQLFDVIADESERNNLAESEPSLVAELMELVKEFNATTYVEALLNNPAYPVENECPFNDERGVLTPC